MKNRAPPPPLQGTQCPRKLRVCVPWLLSSHLTRPLSHSAQHASSDYAVSRELAGLNVCCRHETLHLVLISTTYLVFFPFWHADTFTAAL